MNTPRRTVQVGFLSAEEFRREHATNLLNGGVFVETEVPAVPREAVTVEMTLAGCSAPIRLDGEIVHIVPPEMAGAGARPGVAVQFSCKPTELRSVFEPFVSASGAPAHTPQDSGRRKSPRAPAQLPIRIESGDAVLVGHTRDLSQSSVLVSVRGDELPVGTRVRITIKHPGEGSPLVSDAKIARQLSNESGVMALAIEFDPPTAQRSAVSEFIEEVLSVEHTRRLGGIRGAITEIGTQKLLQMLSKGAPSGTLTLRRGDEEAVIGFDGGALRYARIGVVSGLKVLARVFDWSEGSFEFHTRLEPVETSQLAIGIEAAVLDATRQLDELRAHDLGTMQMDFRVRFNSDPVGPGGDSLSKLERAVLDLAQESLSVRRILDVIPESDVDILRAIAFLVDLDTVNVSPK